MNNPTAQTVVLTTSAPGVAWFALVTAGIEASRAAVITRPGVAIDAGDQSLEREICAALALTGANQLAVIGYAEDTVYQLGARGLANLTRKSGGDPGCFTTNGQAVLPGLKGDAAATVQRTVRKLARESWLPPGLVLMGVVVSRNGTSDNVALDVVGEGRAAAPAEEPSPPVEMMIDLEPHPLLADEPDPVEAPWPDLGGEPAPELKRPQAVEAPTGPVAAAAPSVEGPVAVGGPTPSGPVGLGGAIVGGHRSETASALGEMAESGPVGLGNSVLGGSALGGQALGTSMLGGSALEGPLEVGGSVGAVVSAGSLPSETALGPAVPQETREGDLLDRWFTDHGGRTVADMGSKAVDTESGDVDARLAAAATVLHQFLRSQKFQPPIDHDMRNLLHDGASPEAIMRHLKILVTEFTGDRNDVRAAFGTLEMAQTLLTREDLTDVLRRILR